MLFRSLGGENNLNVGINTISTGMISLGISGFISCILIGFYLNRKRIPFHQKPPIVAGFSAATLFLVVISGYITPQLYVPWIFVLGFVFGASTCIMYSFIFDLIPQQYRGLNAGILTGIIYLIGASSMEEWTFWNFRRDIIIWLGLTLIIQIIYIIFNTFDEEQIAKIQDQPPKYTFDLKLVCVLLFLILFIDSFGFLRIVGNPEILAATWQGTQGFRFYIGMIHFTTAILIGVYYNKLKPLNVAMISVILFILADGMLALIEFNPTIKYILPILYASAVSIYTLVFLSLLADISTKENYYKVIGIGMAVFGWFSSYLATAISLSLIGADITNPVVSFRTHLGIASLIAIITLGFIIWMKKATQSK